MCACVCVRALLRFNTWAARIPRTVFWSEELQREVRGGEELVSSGWGGGETRTDTILFRVRGRLRKGKISRNVSKVHIDTHIGDSNDKVTHKGQINQPVRTTLSLY